MNLQIRFNCSFTDGFWPIVTACATNEKFKSKRLLLTESGLGQEVKLLVKHAGIFVHLSSCIVLELHRNVGR